MRTTVTLDPDLAARLRQLARERDASFKDVLNATIRAGLGAEATESRQYRVRARRMGVRPGIDLAKALQFAASLEDQEIAGKLERGK